MDLNQIRPYTQIILLDYDKVFLLFFSYPICSISTSNWLANLRKYVTSQRK